MIESAPGQAWRRWAVITPILLLAAAVRLLGIGNTNLWGDEAFSVMASLGPIPTMFQMLSTGEPHPPLYPLLIAGWIRLFGDAEAVVRLPSAFAGIASTAVAVAIGARLSKRPSDRGGLLGAAVAGLLVALNPFQVWYSQEARMYAQVSFFAGLSTLALLRMERRERGGFVPYALAILGVVGTHYFGLYVPLSHGVAVAWTARRRPSLARRWLLGSTIAAALFAPWLLVARGVVLHYYGAQPGTIDLRQIALQAWVRVAAGWSLEWRVAIASAVVLSLLAVAGAMVPSRSSGEWFARWFLVFWLVVPYVAGYLVSLARPMYAERYLIVSSLPFILLVGRALSWTLAASFAPARPASRLPARLTSWFDRWRRPIGVAAGLGATVIVLSLGLAPLANVWQGQYLKSAYNTHVGDVDALFRPGDAVILDGTSQLPLYSYYLRRPWPTYAMPPTLPLDLAKTTDELTTIARAHTGAWIFLYATPDYDPGYLIPRWLSRNAYRSYDNWQVTGRLQYYQFAPDNTLTATPTTIRFGGLIGLAQVASTTGASAAGDSIPLRFQWQRPPGQRVPTRVSLRLVDATGVTWGQADKDVGGDFFEDGDWPDGQTLVDRHGLMIPLGTPPGDYRVLLNVYQTGSPNPLTPTGTGLPVGPAGVELRTVHVARPSDHLWTRGIGGFVPVGAPLAGGVELEGLAGSSDVAAGTSATLSLYWKSLVSQPTATTLHLDLVATSGSLVGQADLPLATPAYPTSSWPTGGVLREIYHLPIPAALPPSTYQVRAQVLGAGQSASVGPGGLELTTLRVTPGVAVTAVAPPQHPLADTLGNAVALDGYDLEADRIAPGGAVRLALHWSDVARLDTDYTVFVHLLNADEKVVAQRDQPPAAGRRPTTSWLPGDQILDSYVLDVPAGTPPGSYVLEVGMYNPNTGARLPVALNNQPAGDRVIVTRIAVAS